MKLRRLLFHLPLYAGLIAGLLVSLTGITGSLLVYSHELDSLLYPRLLHTGHPIGFLFSLHTELLAEESGKTAVGVGGLFLLFLGVTGVILWWAGEKGLRQGLTVQSRGVGSG